MGTKNLNYIFYEKKIFVFAFPTKIGVQSKLLNVVQEIPKLGKIPKKIFFSIFGRKNWYLVKISFSKKN